jgi:hypothetical protein
VARGQLYEQRGEFDRAMADASRALALGVRDPQVPLLLARLNERRAGWRRSGTMPTVRWSWAGRARMRCS